MSGARHKGHPNRWSVLYQSASQSVCLSVRQHRREDAKRHCLSVWPLPATLFHQQYSQLSGCFCQSTVASYERWSSANKLTQLCFIISNKNEKWMMFWLKLQNCKIWHSSSMMQIDSLINCNDFLHYLRGDELEWNLFFHSNRTLPFLWKMHLCEFILNWWWVEYCSLKQLSDVRYNFCANLFGVVSWSYSWHLMQRRVMFFVFCFKFEKQTQQREKMCPYHKTVRHWIDLIAKMLELSYGAMQERVRRLWPMLANKIKIQNHAARRNLCLLNETQRSVLHLSVAL